MKTIVISGARSGVGKSTLAQEIVSILPGAVHVKIGHHAQNPIRKTPLYPMGTTARQICSDYSDFQFIIIESNSILADFTPDCTFFCASDNPKPSSDMARSKADIIRGKRIAEDKIQHLSCLLEINESTMRQLAWLCGARPSPVTAIILAGGKSSRMGRNKALLEIDGIPMLKRIHTMLQPFFDNFIISSGSEPVRIDGCFSVTDQHYNCGPLEGIYAGLAASSTERNFVIACDIPAIDFYVLFKILSFSECFDIAVPSLVDGQVEPLYAFYNRNTVQAARRLLDNNILSVRALQAECNSTVHRFHESKWYHNLNTPDEFNAFVSSLSQMSKSEHSTIRGVA